MRLSRLPAHLATTLLYVATVFVTQFAGFVLLPIITRFLSPEAYGDYTITLAISSLVGMFASSWIRNVSFRFYYDAKAAGTTRSFFWSTAGLQAALLVLVFAAVLAVLAAAPDPLVAITTMMAAAAMVVAGDFLALTVAVLRAEQLSGRFAIAELTSAGTRLLGTTAGLVAGIRDPSFLFLAAAAASAAGGIVAIAALRPRLAGPLGVDRRAVAVLSRHAAGALPFSVGEWLNTLMDRLILDHFATRAVVGIYGAGHTLADRLMGGVVAAVFMMAWPDVLNAFNAGAREGARAAVRRYLQVYLWLTVGPLFALVLYASTIVQLLGGAYQAAVEVTGLIALAAWSRGLGNCFNRHLELAKRFAVLSGITLVGAAVNVALNFLLIPTYMAVGAASATLASQVLVAAIFIATRDRRLVDVPWRDVGLVLAAVVLAGGIAWPVFGQSVVGVVTFGSLYVALLAIVWWRKVNV